MAEATAALFTIVSGRGLHGLIALTTNVGIPAWDHIIDDPTVAAAMIERLLRRSIDFDCDGDSNRDAYPRLSG